MTVVGPICGNLARSTIINNDALCLSYNADGERRWDKMYAGLYLFLCEKSSNWGKILDAVNI